MRSSKQNEIELFKKYVFAISEMPETFTCGEIAYKLEINSNCISRYLIYQQDALQINIRQIKPRAHKIYTKRLPYDAGKIIKEYIKGRTPKTEFVIRNAVDELPSHFTFAQLLMHLGIKHGAEGYDRIKTYLRHNYKSLNLTKIYGGYRKTTDKPIIKELKEQAQQSKGESLMQNYTETFIESFLKLPNEDKAKLVSTIMPIVTEKEMLVKFDELYPNYILADAKAGDKLFHPLIGFVEIKTAEKNKLSFYGNGQSWECTRNGNIIINGKIDQRRILFIDMNDYIEYMKK
jgi:hypothetical protein